ncbi:DNA phosphorothioation-dependent restriction protein DptF [Paenibacillus athensensis]|uniref:DNA phosphorothioation-dependent restriction protein DptF n=1 Tax=Paenibacillus athensensis TaxID=1967502 RepID=A0A4Y8PQU8_9BACL|nr:DNA phosphorothioation-dependent restriction protein DptF [Paenibacillus athensensis]MCD1262002.1 DNA phosphorothioation-dependent restriction protein DptF [Paenibacillus athensensis]
MTTTCLVEELKKLKVSSKEAVENLDAFSDFKTYMHIKRDVEDELYKILKAASASFLPQLIFVCGGVGDGKSHLMSYMKNRHLDIIKHFDLHNDATESFNPQKTSIDTLSDVLAPFSDEELRKGHSKKMILAINLGALNNFIDSEYHSSFQQLREFVEKNRILENEIVDNAFQEDRSFQFINFSDFRLYSLTEEGPKSAYMEQVFAKITQPHLDNPFYEAYQTSCGTCPVSSTCPIRANYAFLQDPTTQDSISQALIEGMVKHRLIISTRSLLNFIYDILVSSELDQLPSSKLPSFIENLTRTMYLNHITPSLFFDHKDLSNINEVMHYLDPIRLRTEKMDEIYISLHTRDKIRELLKDVLDKGHYPYFRNLITKSEENFYSHSEIGFQHEDLTKLFFRLSHFQQRKDLIDLRDILYSTYMTYLFLWNSGRKSQLRVLYTQIKEAIYLWNGEADSDQINLFLGKNQLRYKLTQSLELSSYVTDLVERGGDHLNKFSPTLQLKFKTTNEQIYRVDVDFSLYSLLMNIRNGFRPNKKDKANFINFVEFMGKILSSGVRGNELMFQEQMGEKLVKYKLTYDENFGEYNFARISS